MSAFFLAIYMGEMNIRVTCSSSVGCSITTLQLSFIVCRKIAIQAFCCFWSIGPEETKAKFNDNWY